jgi:hypothetical protein
MALPELVRRGAEAKVGAFCTRDTPEHVRDQIRLEFTVRGDAITIVERRAPWKEDLGPEWSSQPIAQMRFDAGTLRWSLWWPEWDNRWHRYDGLDPAPDIDVLLRELREDPTAIFWG